MIFRTILLDPPWPSPAGRRNVEAKQERFPKVSLKDIEDFPLSDLAAEKCHIYIWVMNIHKFEATAIAMMEKNGFKLVNRITWVKTSKSGKVYPALGNYFRLATEYILFGVKGGLPAGNRSLPNVFLAPRGRRVAEKPDVSYEMIEKMSPGPRLEVFSRNKRRGWTHWGNEVDSELKIDWNPGRTIPTNNGHYDDDKNIWS